MLWDRSRSPQALYQQLCRRWRMSAAAEWQSLLGLPSCRSYSADVGAEAQRNLIRQLRERTGAPIKDLKSTPLQCQWDSEAAFTELRKKGLAAASKKASRIASEGLLGVARAPGASAIVEMNCETDYVARNDIFQHLTSRIAIAALSAEVSSAGRLMPDRVDLQSLEDATVILDHPKLNGESTVRDAVAEAAGILERISNFGGDFGLQAQALLASISMTVLIKVWEGWRDC